MAGGARRRGPEASAKNGDAAEDLPDLEEGQWDKVSATPTSPNSEWPGKLKDKPCFSGSAS